MFKFRTFSGSVYEVNYEDMTFRKEGGEWRNMLDIPKIRMGFPAYFPLERFTNGKESAYVTTEVVALLGW